MIWLASAAVIGTVLYFVAVIETEQASENINNWQSVSDISQESFEQDTTSRNTSQLDNNTSAAKLDDDISE